jgi:TrmH family RNA methyltransferase
LEGLALIGEAVRAGLKLEAVYWCPERAAGERERSLVEQWGEHAPCHQVSERVLEAMCSTVTPQAVAAEAWLPDRSLADLRLGAEGLVVGAYETHDPGNLGTLIRTAHAVGAAGLLAVGEGADPYSPKVVRATMGSLFHLPVICRVGADQFRAWCEAGGVVVVAATVHADCSLHEATFPPKTAVLLGSETEGLPEELLGESAIRVRIPMPGGTESLNVAVAGALVMYEYRRQHPATGNRQVRNRL